MKVIESGAGRSSASAAKWPPETRRARRTINLFSIDERSDDPRWMLVQRIAASTNFRRSTLLANFLLFVCDRYLVGQTAEINEKQIGFHVFGRVEGYNASDDNIVRNYARTLRKRLEEYFSSEGKREDLTVVIPRGGYVPIFSPREMPVSAPHLPSDRAALPEDKPDTMEELALDSPGSDAGIDSLTGTADEGAENTRSKWHQLRGFKSSYKFALCTILLSAMAGYFGAHGLPSSWFQHEASAAKVNRIFWSRMFDEKRDTFVVPADGGLVMLQSFIREHVSLEGYANGHYLNESQIAQGLVGLTENTNMNDQQRLQRKVEALGARRYTSIADLELTTRLARLPEVMPERFMIRYARDLRMDDLRTGNVILMGSIEANPWVELFQQQLNFRFSHGAEFGGSGVIANQHPFAGEHAEYASEPNDPLLRTYGVIAYVPNLDGTGHVLLIEGVNMAGTQAAGEFLLDPVQMRPILDRAMSANGVIRPFEVLIETDNIAANASRPHVVSERVG